MNESRLYKIALFLFLPVVILSCNFPQPKISPTKTDAPTVTPYVMPSLAPLKGTPPLAPIATAAANLDACFERCPTAGEIAAVDRTLSLKFETDPTAGAEFLSIRCPS